MLLPVSVVAKPLQSTHRAGKWRRNAATSAAVSASLPDLSARTLGKRSSGPSVATKWRNTVTTMLTNVSSSDRIHSAIGPTPAVARS